MSVEAIIADAHALAAVLSRANESPAAMVDALALVGRLRRRVEGVGVELAGGVVVLSDPARENRLTSALGERSPEMILQANVGLDAADAAAWCRVGAATQPEVTLLGEVLPPRHAAMTAALDAGSLRVGCAARALDVLEQIEPYSSLNEREQVEALLVARAPEVSDRGFARMCDDIAARFVPERRDERDEWERRRAGVDFRTARDGRSQLVIDLHAEAEGFIRAALDAHTAPKRGPVFVDADEVEPEVDRRPLRQKRLDALVTIMRLSLGSDTGKVAGTSVAMHVTIDLQALRTGVGSAKIAGVRTPITASVARRLAADAQIIPVVLGSPSEPLDMGRSVRLGTESQRVALAIRDGGCIWPRCDTPPGWCEVAHIVPWAEGGPTDLDNLMLLCPFHHRCFDNDDWQLKVQGDERFLIPPAWIDHARTPRRVAA